MHWFQELICAFRGRHAYEKVGLHSTPAEHVSVFQCKRCGTSHEERTPRLLRSHTPVEGRIETTMDGRTEFLMNVMADFVTHVRTTNFTTGL